MSIQNVRFATSLLVRSEETEKDHSLVDMAKVLRESPYVVSVEHRESDRSEHRDIESKIDFGDLVLSFKIITTRKYFAMRGIVVNYKGRLITGGWSAHYESFVLDLEEDDKKTIHRFLMAVTSVL